jgi:hypothetical protein
VDLVSQALEDPADRRGEDLLMAARRSIGPRAGAAFGLRPANGLSRRDVLRGAIAATGLLIAPHGLTNCGAIVHQARGDALHDGGLGEPDANGVRLPRGFRSRIVARSGEPAVSGSSYHWPGSPDGGACFATADGGWVYVANSELPGGDGGVGALRFNARAELVAAYPILTGTSLNCAGGATPWGTWLSCEEFPEGQVYECDPLGRSPAVLRPALGTFKHEAAAVDPVGRRVYLTEDAPDGRLYRFTPAASAAGGRLDLSAGTLDVAQVVEGRTVRWHAVPDASAARVPTARQVALSTPFPGSEGMAWSHGIVYFVTKYDNRVWAYDTAAGTIRVIYDDDSYAEPVLTGVDNVAIAPNGDVLVAEDGGHMQIVALSAAGAVYPILQVVGHRGSEIAGPAFDPSRTRLYFSSQRGPHGEMSEGITFEVSGPFV